MLALDVGSVPCFACLLQGLLFCVLELLCLPVIIYFLYNFLLLELKENPHLELPYGPVADPLSSQRRA